MRTARASGYFFERVAEVRAIDNVLQLLALSVGESVRARAQCDRLVLHSDGEMMMADVDERVLLVVLHPANE